MLTGMRQHIKTGGREPDPALYRNLVKLAIPPPVADSSRSPFFFLETDLPGSLSPDARQPFALIVEILPGGRLQYSDAQIIQAFRHKGSGKTQVAPAGISILVEKKRIACVPIDDNDVGKIARLHRARPAEAVNLLVVDVFGSREFLKILHL